MKKVKIIFLGLLVGSLSAFSMKRQEPIYTHIDRSIPNWIKAYKSDGISLSLKFDPIAETYSGWETFRRPVRETPTGARLSPPSRILSAQDAEELYKELSRVEKG